MRCTELTLSSFVKLFCGRLVDIGRFLQRMLPPNFREMMRMNVVCFLLFLFARKMKMMGNAEPYSNLFVCCFPGALKLKDGFAPWMVAWQARNDPASETFTLCLVAHAF
jgi:hypothetical protein